MRDERWEMRDRKARVGRLENGDGKRRQGTGGTGDGRWEMSTLIIAVILHDIKRFKRSADRQTNKRYFLINCVGE